MRPRIALAVATVLLLAGCNQPGTQVSESFEGLATGQLPKAMQVVTGRWNPDTDASAPEGPGILRQDQTSLAFPVLLHDADVGRDFDVGVWVFVERGTQEREGGLVLRYQGSQGHYVANIDAKEGGVRFTRVHEGVRDDLVRDLDAPTALGRWHHLEVRARGDTFTGWLDGAQVFTVRDGTFDDGQVGLWTKRDAVVRFDGLEVSW